MFPDEMSVASAFVDLGYPGSKKDSVKQFQRDWNKVVASLADSSDAKQQGLTGTLAIDGIPGKFTLRAVEIATKNVFDWQTTLAYAGG